MSSCTYIKYLSTVCRVMFILPIEFEEITIITTNFLVHCKLNELIVSLLNYLFKNYLLSTEVRKIIHISNTLGIEIKYLKTHYIM